MTHIMALSPVSQEFQSFPFSYISYLDARVSTQYLDPTTSAQTIWQ